MENTTSKTAYDIAKSNKTEEYKHPPIVMDMVIAYKNWYGMHQHLPKLFRVTISTDMLDTLSQCIEIAVLVNFNKNANDNYLLQNIEKLLDLRGKIELLKAYAQISWEMKFISHGFFAQYYERLEKISKQAIAWQNLFIKKKGADG